MSANVFTIPLHRAFADALVAGLIARAGGDQLVLARGLVLLPNNRAVRTMTDAFVRRAEAGLMLPRLVAIGDIDGSEAGAMLDPIGEDRAHPPAIDPLRRQLILARLVQQVRRDAADPVDAAEAMRLAADLARTLDQLIAEEIAPVRLADSVAPELSEHWQASLTVLETILDRWPRVLAAAGAIDASDRHNRMLRTLADLWKATPPAGLVVAAGITGSTPALAALLRRVSRMEQGMVVLPGVDLAMPAAEWEALGPHEPSEEGRSPAPSIETHPQYHLKLLLDRMGVARGEVARWRYGGGEGDAPAVRSRAIGNAMAPARFTGKWQTLPPRARRLSGIRAAEFASPADEARGIAIAMRGMLEQPGKTAALVTPDRALARRVVSQLRRWNIAADDSAGRPLSATPPGALLLALAEAAAESFAPVPLLALLKHPLVQPDDDRLAWLDGVRRLDRALRGPRPAAGLDGLSDYLAGGEGRDTRVRKPAGEWWAAHVDMLRPVEAAFAGGAELGPLVTALRVAASALGGDGIWSGPAGRAAADLIAGLEDAAVDGPLLADVTALPILLRGLMEAVAVRPPQGGHPRLFVWGLIEARLQHADLIVLGGLNEGTWPAAPAPDPWLAPRIRQVLGLPGLERRIGLAAHDFASGLGARRVLVTRARRDARAPAIASRFWLRMEAMTGGITRDPRLMAQTQAIDHVAGPPAYAARPAPSPPIADRPRRIAVTRLDRLKADPYAFYAGAMLKLDAWDMVDADPSAAWRGTAVHAVFEAWMREDRCDPAALRPRAARMLAETSAHPVLRALWTPRLLEAIDWVAERIAEGEAEGRVPLIAEVRGKAEVAGIELFGTVDRIDRMPDGRLAIVDYKTGKAPSKRQVEAGYAMQLGLLGLIAEQDGFPDLKGDPAAFEYWSLAADGDRLGHASSPVGIDKQGRGIDPAEFTRLAASVLGEAVDRWLLGDAPFTAKLHPEYAPYGDYDQLMRLDEWYGRSDGA
ncbi:double-strand break repair protein AddB [Sphingomonas prati]|uniref:ATP-dependent helicase/nuclease subunit B n=1 Tax=Sphingomonas prati TaxID=1843237 RepID=A0A7W9BST3_9SPHN|nr:double-strand break repair protein AddB [Sphingomonas prati]MBB5729479.1 ATP-dependent helicase/nuclease subunit B [Sphingomonas prati]GGE77081.1 double-strand break repair protein AddB [Sphingomonas prati]